MSYAAEPSPGNDSLDLVISLFHKINAKNKSALSLSDLQHEISLHLNHENSLNLNSILAKIWSGIASHPPTHSYHILSFVTILLLVTHSLWFSSKSSDYIGGIYSTWRSWGDNSSTLWDRFRDRDWNVWYGSISEREISSHSIQWASCQMCQMSTNSNY